ncbi:MAG: tRNA (adenosine(37)-N6)-methyltransferase TrmM, partial [Salinivirgaceae bacterium]
SKPSHNEARNRARQTTTLTIDELFANTASLLKSTGTLSIILPFDQQEVANQIAEQYLLYPQRTLHIKPTPAKPPHRFISEYTFTKQTVQMDTLVIEDGGRHCYSEKYKSLTNDFYLSKHQ